MLFNASVIMGIPEVIGLFAFGYGGFQSGSSLLVVITVSGVDGVVIAVHVSKGLLKFEGSQALNPEHAFINRNQFGFTCADSARLVASTKL